MNAFDNVGLTNYHHQNEYRLSQARTLYWYLLLNKQRNSRLHPVRLTIEPVRYPNILFHCSDAHPGKPYSDVDPYLLQVPVFSFLSVPGLPGFALLNPLRKIRSAPMLTQSFSFLRAYNEFLWRTNERSRYF